MILQCSALSKIRDKYLPRFVNLIPKFNYIDCDENIKFILDCTNAKCERASLEAVSRGGGGGVLSPFDGGGVWPEKKGVRELLFIPKKGGGVRELE